MPGPVSSTSNSKRSTLALMGGGDVDLSRETDVIILFGSLGLISRAVFGFFPSPSKDMLFDLTDDSEPDGPRTFFEFRPDSILETFEPFELFEFVEPLRLLGGLSTWASPTHLTRTVTNPPAGVNFLVLISGKAMLMGNADTYKLLLTRLITTWRILC